ncbi:MAG: hypothetical protein ACK5MH_09235 [Bacteroidales bacterium]
MEEKYNQLIKMAQAIQEFLEQDVSDNPNDLVDRLSTINTFLATSGKALADAKLLQDSKVKKLYDDYFNQISGFSPTVATKFINAMTDKENYLVNWLDRINRTLVHSGDNIRTQVSFAKEELRLTKQGY